MGTRKPRPVLTYRGKAYTRDELTTRLHSLETQCDDLGKTVALNAIDPKAVIFRFKDRPYTEVELTKRLTDLDSQCNTLSKECVEVGKKNELLESTVSELKKRLFAMTRRFLRLFDLYDKVFP